MAPYLDLFFQPSELNAYDKYLAISELPLPGDEREEHSWRGLGANVAHGAAAAGAPRSRGGPPRAPRAKDERRG